MAWEAALSVPPFAAIDDAIREFACEALNELSSPTLDEVVEILSPFLLDQGIASDEDDVRKMCAALEPLQGNQGLPERSSATHHATGSLLAAPVRIIDSVVKDETVFDVHEPLDDDAATFFQKSSTVKKAQNGKNRAPLKELTSSTVLQLRSEDGSATTKAMAQVLRLVRGNDADEGGLSSAVLLAESFVAYATDRKPQVVDQWCALLLEVVDDANTILDEDDNASAARKAISEMYNRAVLICPEPKIEKNSIVLAVLSEDGDWHQAVVDDIHDNDTFSVTFLEYGKPQVTHAKDIRMMDSVVDDDETGEAMKEGECELCHRIMLLTFHHLIPKDTHPTYLKKRLPRGIEGEPTRGFLNSYGTMICRRCHNMVHSLASNAVLATEYNTVEKLLAHPLIGRYVEWAKKSGGSVAH